MLKISRSFPELSSTQVAETYRYIAAQHLKHAFMQRTILERATQPLEPEIDRLAAPDATDTLEPKQLPREAIDEKITLINNKSDLLDLEVRYAVRLSLKEAPPMAVITPGGVSMRPGEKPPAWDAREIEAMRITLEKFSEGAILFLPNFDLVEKVNLIAAHQTAIGAVLFDSAVVQIRKALNDDPELEAAIPPEIREHIAIFTVVFAHELGHKLQYGPG